MNSSSGAATVLLIGSGGREHAMAWKLAQSPRISRLIVAPGNDGMGERWERWATSLAADSFAALADRARAEGVTFAVIGPDNPLADGIVDVFEARGIPCFGPTAAAARIESSKGFAKEVMKAAGVPTAEFVVVPNAAEAEKFLRSVPWPPRRGLGWVVKADGLALGKGVRVCGSLEEARRAVAELPQGKLVIEERLSGEELSWFAFCDGERCAVFEPARDYKRVGDGDRGPNTGGMGAFSPVPGVPESWATRVRDEVFLPTLRELKKRNAPFKGLLYAGLMADIPRDRFWVIEFNARFGDPETQVVLPRMTGDLFEWCEAASRGDLARMPERVPARREAAVTVIATAAGYPDSPRKGDRIAGVAPLKRDGAAPPARDGMPAPDSGSSVRTADAADPDFFFAGVASDGAGGLKTSGGRVLAACGTGPDLERAREAAYARLKAVSFEGMQFRSDIAAPKPTQAPPPRLEGGWR